MLTNDTNIAISIVAPNDENSKPLPTMADVKLNIPAFITIVNNPRVNIVMGNDKMNNTGFTAIFSSANTILAPNDTQMFST